MMRKLKIDDPLDAFAVTPSIGVGLRARVRVTVKVDDPLEAFAVHGACPHPSPAPYPYP